MRPHNRLRLLFMLVVPVLLSISCGEVDVTAVDAASVAVEPERETFPVGETRQFTVRVVDAAGNELRGRTVVWTVSDAAVASVDGDGRVTGLATGEARVSAQVENVNGEATVVIMPRPSPARVLARVPWARAAAPCTGRRGSRRPGTCRTGRRG